MLNNSAALVIDLNSMPLFFKSSCRAKLDQSTTTTPQYHQGGVTAQPVQHTDELKHAIGRGEF